MATTPIESAIEQLDDLIDAFDQVDDSGEVPEWTLDAQVSELVMRAQTCVARLCTPENPYSVRFKEFAEYLVDGDYSQVPRIHGLLRGLRHDLSNGYLESFISNVREDVFEDFLELAGHFLSSGDEGYKDAAAVLIGGVMEEHLRKLCSKHAINPAKPVKGGVRPLSLAEMNTELFQKGAYSKLARSQVETWSRIRNDAAHARYSEYSKGDVMNFLEGFRNFMASFPA